MNLATQIDLLAGYKLHARKVFQGIPVSIENRAGSIRRGVDPGGKPWATKMCCDYGRIPRTRGMDGEMIDAFLGPNQNAKNAFVIMIKKPPDFKTDDEEKVMLGFSTLDDAKKAFHSNYDNPKFFGRCATIPMDEFKDKVVGQGLDPLQLAAYGTSEGASKGWDTRGRGRKAPAEGLASPNVREGTTLSDAIAALRSQQHASFRAEAQGVLRSIDEHGLVQDGIGSWTDGAEDTVVMDGTMSWDEIRYATAKMGLSGKQKGVIAFHSDPRGKASLWSVSINKVHTPGQISAKLDEIGIADRTIIPGPDGATVHVFDSDSEMESKIAEVAKAYATNYKQEVGQGEYIGGATREEGATAFRAIIDQYEHRRGIRSAQDSGQSSQSRGRHLFGPSATEVKSSFDSQASPMGMAHIEPMPSFHPPSLKNPRRVPTDDPGETDDSDMNVTKRHEKANEDLRMRIASRKGSDFKNLSMAIRTTALPWGPATGEGGIAASRGSTVYHALPQSRLWRRRLRERANRAQEAARTLEAYGTTEGVLKEWDERGRGHNVPQRDTPPSGLPSGVVFTAPTKPLEPGQDTEHAWRNMDTGQWDMGREVFHEDVVNALEHGKKPPVGRKPIAWILGGGTASGKTTASAKLIGNDPNMVRVDPDEIKTTIPEYASLKETDQDHAAARVHEESSYMTKMAMADIAGKGLDVVYDSTTSGNGGPGMAKMLLANGYDVRAAFYDVPVSVAKQRAEDRRLNSPDPINRGRKVADDVILKNHRGAAEKFFEVKDIPGMTSSQFFDNDVPRGTPPKLVYEKNSEGEHVYNQARFDQYRKKGQGLAD